MKLELKHLAPYLPYGLNGEDNSLLIGLLEFRVQLIHEPTGSYGNCEIKDFKPILRPLSDLKESDFFDEHISLGLDTVFMWNNIMSIVKHKQYSLLPQSLFKWLLENHFDVFRLIEKDLAIDINTLEK